MLTTSVAVARKMLTRCRIEAQALQRERDDGAGEAARHAGGDHRRNTTKASIQA